ncbi:MAG: TonB-dependent receptor [Chitinophagales bacterium]|nr:TonB-dependent receptor [Chitinophagales bacterium]
MIKPFLIFSILTILFYGSVKAQSASFHRDTLKTGVITGKVVDAKTGLPLELATLFLQHIRDSSLVTGSSTNDKGNFMMDHLSPGVYRIKITYIGYQNKFIDTIRLSSDRPQVILKLIKLEPVTNTLAEVQVTAGDIYRNGIEKKTYDVGKDISSSTGTAAEVLQNIPSVTVDVDGKVSLRGNENVNIMVDGKPSSLTLTGDQSILQQLPASAIESIEVMTNPNAKYDPEGTAGIINIVLKKNKLMGFSGLVSLNAGTGDKYNGTVNIGYRTKKWNLFLNYSARIDHSGSHNDWTKENFLSDSLPFFMEHSHSTNKNQSQLVKTGISFLPDLRNTFTATITPEWDRNKSDAVATDFQSDAENILRLLTYVYTKDTIKGSGIDYSLDYRRTFSNPNQILSSTITYNNSKRNQESANQWQPYNTDFTSSAALPYFYTDPFGNNSNIWNWQADYAQPFSNKTKLETGIKTTIRKIETSSSYSYLDTVNNEWISNPARENDFRFNENTYAAYGIYSFGLSKYLFQMGLRLEQTNTKGHQEANDASFTHNYFSFFPSVNVTRRFNDKVSTQLSYSRRINRPMLMQLNPLVDYSDLFNITKGNPELRPEYIHSLELSYNQFFSSSSFTPSLYLHYTQDAINRFISVDSNNVNTVTFQNYKYNLDYGAELTGNWATYNWWNLVATFNCFRSIRNAENLGQGLVNKNISYSAKIISNMNFMKQLNVQLTAFYNGTGVTVQGTRRPVFSSDLSTRVTVMKGRGAITARLSDIFNTREFRITVDQPYFSQEITRKRESRILFFGFSYRFGNNDKQNERSKRGDNNIGDLPQENDVY